jgi:hypothetical protein
MRSFIIILAIALTLPAAAQGGDTYANARYGATASVPSGFEPTGPEAANSDGLIFRSSHGGLLTIFGADVSGGNFEAYVNSAMAHDKSYNGWAIQGSKITPDWAEYWGNVGARQLRVRTISACGGRHALSVKLEYNGNMDSVVSKVFRSLKEGPAHAC